MDDMLTSWKDHANRVPDEDVFMEIIIRISDGMSLKDVLKIPGMPSNSSFFRWLNGNKEWMEAYLMAQTAKMHTLAEETVEIADNIHPKLVKKGELQVKTRQWMVERLARKHFADPKNNAPMQVGNLTINNNTIHALLTKGTELSHIVEVKPLADDSETNLMKDITDATRSTK